jgi:hypothetical protein
MRTWTAWLLAGTLFVLAAGVRAQQSPPSPPKTGNPTPGTPQPDPPELADRVTLTGCLETSPGVGAAPTDAQTVPSDSRYVLARARKESRVPPGTGTSAAAGAPAAGVYRLEALEAQLSPVVGTQVEISGEVKPGAAGAAPVLRVEFVQKIAAQCR